MFERNSQLELLLDLETRHDDLLSRLEELDERVAKTLTECMRLRQSETCPIPNNNSSSKGVGNS